MSENTAVVVICCTLFLCVTVCGVAEQLKPQPAPKEVPCRGAEK